MVRFGPVFDTEQLEGSEDSGGWWEWFACYEGQFLDLFVR